MMAGGLDNNDTTLDSPPLASVANWDIQQNEYKTISVAWIDFSASTYKPHGDQLYCKTINGTPGEDPYFFMHKGDKLVLGLSIAGGLTAGLLTLILQQWTPSAALEGNVEVASPTLVSNVRNVFPDVVAPNPGYYKLMMCNLSTGGGNLNLTDLTYTGGGDGRLCHRAVKDAKANLAACNEVRMEGFSMLYTNTAPKDGRAGQVSFQQIPKTQHWLNMLTSFGTFSSLDTGSRPEDIAEGQFQWCMPASTNDMALHSYHEVGAGQLLATHGPLRHEHEYLMGWLNVPPPASTTSLNPQSGLLICESNFEYRSTDTWRSKGPPEMTMQECEGAGEHLQKVTRVTKNPTHVKDLLASIFGAFKGGAREFVKGTAGAIDKFLQ